MAKRSKPPKVPANPEPDTQQKDDRIKAIRELTLLATALIQLLIAVITLIILLIKGR